MKRVLIILCFSILGFFASSCGEEIDACVGAASDPVTGDVDCDDCCISNGYDSGVTSTTTSAGGTTTRKCQCR